MINCAALEWPSFVPLLGPRTETMENVYLPCKLELAILARLDKRDLKTVRLVSREWSALATGPFVRGGLHMLQGA